MLDNVLINHYATAMKQPGWIGKSQVKATAADVAVDVVRAFCEDLRHAMPLIASVRTGLADAGFDLTPVRILEVLIWTQIEPSGYYRTG
jgi:hypothetical protein